MDVMDVSETRKPLPLLAFDHVSRVCSDLEASCKFYTEVLGFSQVRRPSSFEFAGAWLFKMGMGLHLIKGCPPSRPRKIEPKSCHISFQAASLDEVESCLVALGIEYVKSVFVEDGIQVGQLFFHDPDNNMIEVCNCDELPVVPLTQDALACPARPLAPAAPQLRSLPMSLLTSLEPAGQGSDTDSDDQPDSASSTDSNVCAMAEGGMTDMGGRSPSSSNSSMSGGTPTLDKFAMGIYTDLDDWPPAHGGSVADGSRASGECITKSAVMPALQDGDQEMKIRAEVVNVYEVPAGGGGGVV